MKIPCRLRPGICSHGDHIYFFGGEQATISEEGMNYKCLDDFYQIKLINRPMSNSPDLWVKNVITSTSPQERVANLVNCGDKYLVLWGGSNL